MQAGTKTFALDYVKTIGMLSNAKGRGFANPYDLAISRDERLFVLSRAAAGQSELVRIGVVTFDDEEYLEEFGKGYGAGDGQFTLPVAMALDSQERLYVTDEYLHRISIFNLEGAFLKGWGSFGKEKGELNGPAGIAIDSRDRLYVVDQHNNRIQVFTTDGEYISHWGEPGSGPGQFNMPWGVTLDSAGQVYVADWRNDRVQKFSPSGEFIASFGQSGTSDGQFHRPSGVAVDLEGYVYVADWGNQRVQVLGPEGDFRLSRRGEATLSRWAEEFFAVNPDEKETRNMANLIPKLPPHLNSPHHISSQTEPYFWGPVSVRLDRAGRLYVIEANRSRIQVYQKR
jgi:DNA-binding beta-propeller fold protein YncE